MGAVAEKRQTSFARKLAAGLTFLAVSCASSFSVSIYLGGVASVVVSDVGLINEVNRHWTRLVLGWAARPQTVTHPGWVTVCGRANHIGMSQVT